jgi:exopolysaccharide biosynthesis WecB/TagA/CpsF family protein
MQMTDLQWPHKHSVFGVDVSATTYDEAADVILAAARARRSALVTHFPVHGLVLASQDSLLRAKVNRFNIVAPDGQPVRWALRLLHRVKLPDRVYGPELMLRLCGRAASEGVGVYLYGSEAPVVERLRSELVSRFPSLVVVGAESPPFRPLTQEEEEETVARINASGAGIVFIGLGCPKQDEFAYRHHPAIRGVQVCVGAAFDFLSGNKRMAPRWMQRSSLEWLFRLSQEPRRLWKRYLVTNSIFVAKLVYELGLRAGVVRRRPEERAE